MKRIGVDVGGTFTDFYLSDDETGRVVIEKVPSTPDDPSRAVLHGLTLLTAKAGIELSQVDELVHGTTVATNIALTHTGAEVGMITTEGFRDILHIARHKKPFNFSLQQELPWQSSPLVKRRHRLTVKERITVPDGGILVPLDEDEVRVRVRELRDAGVESIAVCLLHSYLNPMHEQRIKQIIQNEFPEAFLSISSEVVPLYREFERFSTTALNAYVGPKVSRYLARLSAQVKELGYTRDVLLMQSSGGMTPIDVAGERPVNLLMSGPVGGLIGGIWAGKQAGFDNVVTLDIGGTSADIGVAPGGELRMRHLLDTKVGDYQAMVPMVDIDTIGAGGGSIAFVDDGGIFRVGPASAGARPGPACYGHGGTKPTSTDAQVVLGRLRAKRNLAGGEMQMNVDLARTAMSTVAGQLGMTVEEAALGALQIQKFGMSQAIELNSVRRGYDPRDFTLVGGGGAGALFACEIAAELDIPTVLIPAHPGIIAATGLVATDQKYEYVATARYTLPDVDRAGLESRYASLSLDAVTQLTADGTPADRRVLRRLADGRYEGQGYEVRFEVPEGDITEAWLEELVERFHQAHETEYGHRFATGRVEIVNIRVEGIGIMDELPAPILGRASGGLDRALLDTQDVVFDAAGKPGFFSTPFYDRELLGAGQRLDGPCVIEQYDSTVVVPPAFSATIDNHGNIVIACPKKDQEGAGSELATPILMRVIGGAFNSMAKEMASVLFRMSYSSIIRESEDLGAGIFDADGHVLAESDSTPMFMGAMPKIVRGVMSVLGDDIHEGDIILHNDPYLGATHSPDVAIVMPIFFEGERIGFAGASGQLLDIGGAYPGLAVDLVDNKAEGQIFRAVKIAEKGVRQEALLKHILANTRTPTHNAGDLEAMIAACELATSRFLDVTNRYGKEAVKQAGEQWINYSEAMLRAEIAKVPDGVYETEVGYLDDDGKNYGKKLPIQVKVIIEGDQITYDLTGSSPQVETGYNCPFEGTTVSAFAFITRMIFLDEVSHSVFVPQNEGMLKPIKVIAPKGTIFNPNYPAACIARFAQVQRVVDLALRALSPVLPEKITAGNSAHIHFLSYSGWSEAAKEYWVYLEVNEGSYGGRPDSDGLDSVDNLIANTRNNPIEELEWRFPMRTDRYELRSEAAAPGEFRGGIGIVRENTFLTDTVVTCEGERHESDEPWGIFGGYPGLNGSLVKNVNRDGEENWPSKVTARHLKAGDSLQITVPSSGGYGDPLRRDPQKVLSDVLDEFTTVELAERDYGVAINVTTMTVDDRRTAELRTAELRTAAAVIV
ncbi:hydantoinase B/oxoprolinase family protein [Paenarthrobacter sp. PH39-S1]|uniref:hydantoinase B/oxoprolinase family protein n=1 Tax=Paenarthrobacter sp. PH39-S1 TaxID=3046204 RepID=UPI0024BAAB72|nr:hydantoinase B/oxoprolinase family protein [Paenarthrobacter sp. PH39-S1]MDJ0354661.1 hydantoinase B/oxoprolinase family protein [Paenarthrobacter sp. PH39-S1]